MYTIVDLPDLQPPREYLNAGHYLSGEMLNLMPGLG